MSKALILNESDWTVIYQRIKTEYPPSVYLIRDKMKATLGFTVRTHEHVTTDDRYRRDIRLDFYNESLKTMFLLKYM